MLTVILGIAIILFGGWIVSLSSTSIDKTIMYNTIIFWLGIAIAISGGFVMGMGIIEPFNGFDEPTLSEEITLMPIYVDDETGNEIYASKVSETEFFVKYKENDEIVLTAIECKIVEDDTIVNPVKRLYKYEAKSSIWTLGLNSKLENVLVLPSKNICK